MFKPILKNVFEIYDYITDTSDDYDKDYILDEYRGCTAKLISIPIEDLEQGPPENHLKSKAKQTKYNKMNLQNCPPILIERGGQVIDGHHRIRAHLHQKKKEILAYEIRFED